MQKLNVFMEIQLLLHPIYLFKYNCVRIRKELDWGCQLLFMDFSFDFADFVFIMFLLNSRNKNTATLSILSLIWLLRDLKTSVHLGALLVSSLLNEIVLEVPWSVSRALSPH